MPGARGRLSIAILLCALALAGCTRGPGRDVLEADLLRRLDQTFEDGLFEIRSFARKGSAPFRLGGSGTTGLLVYYDAELEFTRDYSLTAWKGLNLGTLAFVLGATESGIEGFRSQGNAAGEILYVHGRLTFRADDETPSGYASVADGASGLEAEEPRQTDLRGSGPDALLRNVRELLAHTPRGKRNSQDAVIVSELRSAVSRIDLGVARLEGMLTLGTGADPGTYHSFGVAFGEFASRRGLPIYSYESEGSIENGARLRGRSLDLALVQSDIAEQLYQGAAEEEIFPNRDLRSVASLWPEAVHIVTLEGTGVRTVLDLQGRRVAIGQRGSGTRFNALRIGFASALSPGELAEVVEIGLRDGIAALEAGRVDALFVTEAIPSSAIQAFAARRSDVRFVSLERDVIRELSEEHFAYYPLTVEPRTYPGQQEPFQTLGLACALITTRHVSDEAVERVLALMVDGVDELSEAYYRAAFVSRKTMRLGIAVPLHPAAERFYAERDAPSGTPADDEAPGAGATEAVLPGSAPASATRP